MVKILEEAASTHYSAEKPTPDISSLEYYIVNLLQIIENTKETERHEVARLEWMYLPLLVHSERQPKLLHEELSRDPLFFVEILRVTYRSEDDQEEPTELTQAALSRARAGIELLESWHQVPGLTDDEIINSDRLRAWITTARTAANESKSGAIADREIGKVLAYAPKSSDGTFPAVAVREVIEEIASSTMENSFETATYNKRGVQTRFVDDGGLQEREISSTYQKYAALVRYKHPRTAAMLRRIASTYESEAHWHDLEADLAD